MSKNIIDENLDSVSIESKQILHYQHKLQYEIDSWDLYQALEQGEDLVVIDARAREAYEQEHIIGAVNFPHRAINKDTVQKYLDKNIQYVTYCDGIGCNASTKSALKLAQLGYKVKELIGGMDWWKQEGYPTINSDGGHCHSNCGCDDKS